MVPVHAHKHMFMHASASAPTSYAFSSSIAFSALRSVTTPTVAAGNSSSNNEVALTDTSPFAQKVLPSVLTYAVYRAQVHAESIHLQLAGVNAMQDVRLAYH